MQTMLAIAATSMILATVMGVVSSTVTVFAFVNPVAATSDDPTKLHIIVWGTLALLFIVILFFQMRNTFFHSAKKSRPKKSKSTGVSISEAVKIRRIAVGSYFSKSELIFILDKRSWLEEGQLLALVVTENEHEEVIAILQVFGVTTEGYFQARPYHFFGLDFTKDPMEIQNQKNHLNGSDVIGRLFATRTIKVDYLKRIELGDSERAKDDVRDD